MPLSPCYLDSPSKSAMTLGLASFQRLGLVGAVLLAASLGCGSGSGGGPLTKRIVVNSIEDVATPAAGVVTLRSAIAQANSGDTIAFSSALNGSTIALSIVGNAHSVLKGETYVGNTFDSYQERDYGRSALYARKNLAIDASTLPSGITIRWSGGDADPARVMAIYGDLTMHNVTVTGGRSVAEAIVGGTQPYTLARGAGLAVWGTATLNHCTVADNKCIGDTTASRDRGTYGGGIYANGLHLQSCVISGNAALGYGAAGGGIYSVGGADRALGIGNETQLIGCTVSGNRVTAQHAYGGGIFTLSGGPKNLATMSLVNCTVARNLVEDNPDLPQLGPHYYRGGGIYMGGGSLSVKSCTIAENEVTGYAATFSGKPNMGGGGVAATIGNAHTIENVDIAHSIIVGNKMNDAPSDWFTGSLLDFHSYGYNLIGAIDFSQILVPVPDWMNLCRKHYPKVGDQAGITINQALDVASATRSATVNSLGPDSGQRTVLSYPPVALASGKIPNTSYQVSFVTAGYTGFGVASDDFLNQVVLKLRADYLAILGADFAASLGDMSGVTWYGPSVTWPSDPANATWIDKWRSLDTLIGTQLGVAGLNDDVWGTFVSGSLGHVTMTVKQTPASVRLVPLDQLGRARAQEGFGTIGALEL